MLAPPTEYDPQTGEPVTDEWVEVGPGGEVTTWAWLAEPRSNNPLDRAFAWALIKLDGADTAMLHCVDAGQEHRGNLPQDWRADLEAGNRQRKDDGGRAIDLGDVDRRAGGDDVLLVVGPGRPDLAADPHLAAGVADLGDGRGPAADQGRGPRLQGRGRSQVTAGDRPDDAQQKQAAAGEDPELNCRRETDAGRHGGGRRRHGQHPQHESEREHLGDPEQARRDQPEHPVGHLTAEVTAFGGRCPAARGSRQYARQKSQMSGMARYGHSLLPCEYTPYSRGVPDEVCRSQVLGRLTRKDAHDGPVASSADDGVDRRGRPCLPRLMWPRGRPRRGVARVERAGSLGRTQCHRCCRRARIRRGDRSAADLGAHAARPGGSGDRAHGRFRSGYAVRCGSGANRWRCARHWRPGRRRASGGWATVPWWPGSGPRLASDLAQAP